MLGCFLPLCLCAQLKLTGEPMDLFSPHKLVSFPAVNVTPLPAPEFNRPLEFNYNAPKLPFFCSMEDKFRNRFNIFLKFRAGTDESYMKMINACER